MTSIPASRSARAIIFAPRSCPSKPGFATTTRILRLEPAIAGRSYFLRLANADGHAHARVDRADDPVGAPARELVGERAPHAVARAEVLGAARDRHVVQAAVEAPGQPRPAMDADRGRPPAVHEEVVAHPDRPRGGQGLGAGDGEQSDDESGEQ